MAIPSKIYIFSGKFSSFQAACEYSHPQWDPKPAESVSDEEYSTWEDNNPTHQLKRNIDNYLDNDFIETIEDVSSIDRHSYLRSLLQNKSDIEAIKSVEPEGANFFVLVNESAFDGFELKHDPVSTKELSYCGEFNTTEIKII